jgi:hypothetical protein
MSINAFFCTPDQGRRLKELVPSLTSVMEWVSLDEGDPYYDYPYFSGEWDGLEVASILPALTLQELRDVARERRMEEVVYASKESKDVKIITDWSYFTCHATAPELAAWVIERLEATP